MAGALQGVKMFKPGPAKHQDLTHQYGCPASHTCGLFVAHGIVHVVRRLWRSDLVDSGKIELYMVDPYPGSYPSSGGMSEEGWYDSRWGVEAFVRYVPSKSESPIDAMARDVLAREAATRAGKSNVDRDQETRFGLLELR